MSNILLGKSGEIALEIMKRLGQGRNHTQCGCVWWESKIQCCKEQYCVRTWNGRSMYQGKLDVATQATARVNTDILGISELNGQERANLIQMNIIPTTVGKNPLEEME